jgi:hypothetical protein
MRKLGMIPGTFLTSSRYEARLFGDEKGKWRARRRQGLKMV